MINFPPGLVMILASLLVAMPFIKGKAKPSLALVSAIVCLALVMLTYGGVGSCTYTLIDNGVLGDQVGGSGIVLELMQLNAPTLIFATIFSLVSIVGIMYAFNQERTVELSGALLYAGSAVCATYAGDLVSMFIFWELMAVGSTLVVFNGGQSQSAQAGLRYVAVHFLGGVFLMAGIIWYAMQTGSLDIAPDPLQSALVDFNNKLSPAAWLMLIGILINAGAPLLGAWLPDAYPEASPSGTVFLSAFTTKTAIFVLMMLFAGTHVLIWVGIAMVIYGLVYAIIENDIRRVLAYSIINQVGFMVCAVGIGTELALCGASGHAFAHILYKAVLLMTAGSVLHVTGKRTFTELGGLRKQMRWTFVCAIIGALAMAAPLTAAFAVKSMITTAAGMASFEALMSPSTADNSWHYILVWFVLYAGTAGVFLVAGVKYVWFVFCEKPQEGTGPIEAKAAPANMRWAMAVMAFLCLLFGFPKVADYTIYQLLPYDPVKVYYELGTSGTVEVIKEKAYSSWSLGGVLNQISSMLAVALIFFMMIRYLRPVPRLTLDSDWVYRRLIPRFWRAVLVPPLAAVGRIHAYILGKLPGKVAGAVFAKHIDHSFHKDVDLGGSNFELRIDVKTNRYRQWAVGGAMIIITGMLLLYILVNLL